MPPKAQMDPVERATLLVADEVGTLMEFWGFKRVLGRIWTCLYLAEGPLTAAEMGTRLGLSASAISTALAELRRWGVVHEAVGLDPRAAGRAMRYRAEQNVWAMVSNVMRQRELPMLVRFEDSLRHALEALEPLPASTRITQMRRALKALLSLSHLGRSLLQSLLDSGKLDADKLRAFGS